MRNSKEKIQLIYGTGNQGKLLAMKRSLESLPLEIIGLQEASVKYGKQIPEIDENGSSPLENARLKAKAYYELFEKPVFSCDSGLYFWDYETGEMLSEEWQPGIHVRGRGLERYSDEELIERYTALAKAKGLILARYKNAVCLIDEKGHYHESMDESLWGDPFLLAQEPHVKRNPGFPIDSISLDVKTGKYFYDLQNNAQDVLAADIGFARFFEEYIKNRGFVR